MILRPATPQDLGLIRALTLRPDYAPFIGSEDEAQLAAHLANPAHRLLIWTDTEAPRGFALFREIGTPSGAVELFRLALSHPGRGEGQRFLRALVDFAFQELQARRLWLDASAENPRAMATYVKAGFTEEGRLRQHWYRPALGRAVDLVLYGMLRDEWLALAPLPPRA